MRSVTPGPLLSLSLPVLLAGAGHARPPARAPADVKERNLQVNGPEMNGARFAGERSLLKVLLREGVRLSDGSVRRGVTLRGAALYDPEGGDLRGATLVGVASGGASEDVRVVLRLDGQAPSALGADVPLYEVSVQVGGEYAPLCPPEPDGAPRRALALSGVWDYGRGRPGRSGKLGAAGTAGQITLACQGGALAKCALDHGYQPWRRPAEDRLHQACVRAVRADYCGTGESMTTPGVRLNVYDTLGLQQDTQDWVLEALWGPDGATCVSGTRLRDRPDKAGEPLNRYIDTTCGRFRERPCAAPAGLGESRALLITEHAPR